MKRAVVVLGLLVGPACDQLFAIQHIDAIDAREVDAACEDPTPFGSDCRTVMMQITNDTFITATAPEMAFGGRDALELSADEPALLKFDTSTVAADERIAGMTLALDPKYSQQARACSPSNDTCTTCPTPAFGSWQLHWMRTDWNEAEASWNAPTSQATWTQPGAAAIPDDRSEVVASGPPHTGIGSVVMPVSAEQLLARSPNCYRANNQLAILVEIGGAAYFDTHEGTVCVLGTEVPALLTVTLCRDAR